MPSKWARVKAAEFLALDLTIREVESVAEALDAARIEGLEEAAKICEERGNDMDHQASLIGSISVASWGANQCHTAIRRRIEEVKA